MKTHINFFQNIFFYRLSLLDLYLLGYVFGVDIFGLSYILSWMCFIVFSLKISKNSILDIWVKTILSSLICLALFGKLSLFSIPISIFYSFLFSYVYVLGFLLIFVDIEAIKYLIHWYWDSLYYLYEVSKNFDYVIKFHSAYQSSVVLLVILVILFVIKGFSLEKNLWMERVY